MDPKLREVLDPLVAESQAADYIGEFEILGFPQRYKCTRGIANLDVMHFGPYAGNTASAGEVFVLWHDYETGLTSMQSLAEMFSIDPEKVVLADSDLTLEFER